MDLERAMQFILDAQARMTAAQERHDERIAQNEAQIGKNTAQIAAVTNLVGRLAEAEIRLVEDLRGLRATQAEDLRGLRETQATTEESLNALIKIVDGIIRRDNQPPR